MHIKEFYKSKKFVLSFEMIPPRNGEDIEKAYDSASRLMKFKPSFFTVTQSTSGSLRGGTAAIVAEIKKRFNVEGVSHLICAGKSFQDVENDLMLNHYLVIENIMALRGDPPWGEKEFKPAENGFRYGYELVEEIQRKNKGLYYSRKNDSTFFKLDKDAKYREGIKTNFGVSVAGYPEGHREEKDKKKNTMHLKQKVDAGADLIFTQMFFKPESYFDFVKECTKAKINVPIIPGIMPVTFYGQIKFLRDTCAVEIPQDYLSCLEDNKNNNDKLAESSARYITGLCTELIKKGVPGLHFYTLNNWKVVSGIVEKLEI